jgi:protein O-mannosyl-transferase
LNNLPHPNPAVEACGKGGRGKQRVFICLLLALATVAVYWPVARHGFINFDDADYVSGNPRVQAGLTMAGVRWAFTSIYASNWHPVTWLSHMLDCQLYGVKPAGHHITNLLFHVANSLLLFGLLQRLTGAPWRSAFVAALFALHPLHVESVAWVSERKDVLSAFFFMLTLLAYVRYAEKAGVRSQNAEPSPTENATRNTQHALPFYLLSVCFFALGLMSKPMLVTLPFVLLLLDWWPLQRFQLNTKNSTLRTLSPLRLVVEKLPFFALSALSCVVTFLVQRACGAMTPLAKTHFELRLANALVAYAQYLSKTLWPSKLAIFYPYRPLSLDSWQVVGAALLLLAVTAAVVLAWKKQPYLPVGWFWFLGTLVPVIGLVQVGKQSLADRYTYLPHIGLFVMFAWGASAAITRWKWPRLLPLAAAGLTLVACGLVASRQVAYWRTTKTLFQHAVDVTTGNFVAHTVIGDALTEEGKLPEALEQCRLALQIWPNYPEAHNTRGNIYARQEKYDEAIADYRAALTSDPSFPDPHNGLGNVLVKTGAFAEAETQCREALRLAPMHLPAMFCLATALHKQGKLDEAADYYRRILAFNPNLFAPHRYLGNVLVAQGKLDEAIPQLRLALKVLPKDADTHTLLGVVLLDKDRIDEAAAQFSEAAQLQSTNAMANYHLALIHQGRKEMRAAIECFHKALQAQPDWPESLNNLAWILAANPDATLRNGPEAVALAERACKLTDYKEPLLIGTLATAHAEAGHFTEAVSFAEKARALALAAGQKEVAQKNQELLELYRSGRAYHEPQ